jgi:hypothetical protein
LLDVREVIIAVTEVLATPVGLLDGGVRVAIDSAFEVRAGLVEHGIVKFVKEVGEDYE